MKSIIRRISVLCFILVFITIAASCSFGSKNNPPNDSADADFSPTDLTVLLDQSAQVNALVPKKGGQIKMTLANGLVYTLDIPEGALLSDQEVTMTPIRSIDGIPLSGGVIAGVQLEPDGTTLMLPATLTIEVPEGYDLSRMVGFSYHQQGKGFHLSPAYGDGKTVTIEIISFSGHGAASGSDSEIKGMSSQSTGSAVDDYEQSESQILHDATVRDGQINSSDQKKFLDLLTDFYDKTLKTTLQSAVKDDTKIDQAVSMYLYWLKRVQLYGLEGDLSSRIEQGNDLMIKGLKNAYDMSYNRCIKNQNIDESKNMIKRLTQLESSIPVDPNYTLEGKKEEVSKCIRFRLSFESIITMDVGGSYRLITHVTSSVILKTDPSTDGFLMIYKGNAPLKYIEYTGEFYQDGDPMKVLCKSEQQPVSDGTLEVMGRINYKNLNSNESKTTAIIGVKPSTVKQSLPKFTCIQSSLSMSNTSDTSPLQTLLTADIPVWSMGFDKVHKDRKSPNIEGLTDAYWFSKFESVGGNVFGRYTETKSTDSFTDELLMEIYGQPGAE